MPYAEGRTYFDADSHVMELPGWLEEYADPAIRDRIRPLHLGGAGKLADKAIADAEQRRGDEQAALQLEDELMTKKGWASLGASTATNAAAPSTCSASTVSSSSARSPARSSCPPIATCCSAAPPRSTGP
jgi:hypothetical protein